MALEITQRCNLDCTLCYLSDYSEAVPDPPMEELKAKAASSLRHHSIHPPRREPESCRAIAQQHILGHCHLLGQHEVLMHHANA